MGILSISFGRMCKRPSPLCFNIWQIVLDRLAARDVHLYNQTANQSPLFRYLASRGGLACSKGYNQTANQSPLFQYLANRGGKACSKRGASICSNATAPRMFQYLAIVSTPPCFFSTLFPTLPRYENSLFLGKSTKTPTLHHHGTKRNKASLDHGQQIAFRSTWRHLDRQKATKGWTFAYAYGWH